MHAWHLNPAHFETIHPFPVPPTSSAPFTFNIAPDKDEALLRARKHAQEHNICLYSGSGIEGHIGAAAITDARDDTFTQRLQLGSGHDHTVFESEVVGTTLAISSIPSLSHIKMSSSELTTKAKSMHYADPNNSLASTSSSNF
jgi:hypothetical protein